MCKLEDFSEIVHTYSVFLNKLFLSYYLIKVIGIINPI